MGATASLGARAFTNRVTLASSSAKATSTLWPTGLLVSRCQKSLNHDSSGPATAASTACSTPAPCPSPAGVTGQRLSPPTTNTPRRSLGSVVALTASTASSRVMPPTSTPATVTPARMRPDEALTRAVAATLMVASRATARPTITAMRCQPDSPAGRFQVGRRIPGTFMYEFLPRVAHSDTSLGSPSPDLKRADHRARFFPTGRGRLGQG